MIKIKKIILITLISLFFVLENRVIAQERGPLFMTSQLGYTLAGSGIGMAIGFLVWFTDPGGTIPIQETVTQGAVIGTFLGAIGGVYLLHNAHINPNRPQFEVPSEDPLNDLLGYVPPPLHQQNLFQIESDIPPLTFLLHF